MRADAEPVEGDPGVVGRLDLAAVGFEDLAEGLAGQGRVVDDEDARIHGA